MEQYLIIARSVTYAQRMEKLLSRAGIRVRIYRAPRELSDRGCAYAVQLSSQDLEAALPIINGAGLGPVQVYRIRSGGNARPREE